MIEQSYSLKCQLQALGLRPDNCTIFTLDAQDYYPSIHLKLVKKAIWYFASNLPEEAKATISTALELIEFGMTSTVMTFQDKYYIYDGSPTPRRQKPHHWRI